MLFFIMMTLLRHFKEDFSILITDDDENCRYSLKDIFEPEGYTTYLASCGREAVEIAKQKYLHLLILDIHLPDFSGFDTFEFIKEEKKSIMPCIFVSADTSKELKMGAIEANAYTLISKPINKETIKYAVERSLEKYYWK
ncbi:MAG: response regulator [Candidatus Scalindua sp.]|nr:response regulator [Candidatus Scalindua sp.]